MTTDELKAIEHADERAIAAQEAIVKARTFDSEATRIRDSAMCELRAGGMSYGQIADLTGIARPTVISATRFVKPDDSP